MTSSRIIDQVDLIRQVFAYAHRFRGRTFVIHVDYGAVEDARLSDLVQDLVLLHQAGIRIILVPGARQRIDEVLSRYHVPWRREGGIRIASSEAIPFIKMAAFDVTNRFMTLLSANHTNAVTGNWVRARGLGVVDGVDYEHAGVVERVQLDLLRQALEQNIIPIFPCIGWSVSGKPYNISSRELAFRIAVSIEADKLFFITDRMGVPGEGFTLPEEVDVSSQGHINRLSVEQARELLLLNGVASEELQGETLSTGGRRGGDAGSGTVQLHDDPSGYHDGPRDILEYVRIGYLAASRTVNRVHIVDGRRDGVVLVEVFSSLGVGTMIHANVYQSIRPMRADEVSKVHQLLVPLAERGILVHRSEENVASHVEDYVVHETDGRIHGCGALHAFENGDAEIASIAVDPAYEELGIGRKIVLFLIELARERGVRDLFVLTTQTADWFESIGFVRAHRGDLPRERLERYDPGRNSQILKLRI